MTDWTVRQLTFGSADGFGHSHSYYDIPVSDRPGNRVLVHQSSFTGRHPNPDDQVAVGLVHVDQPGKFVPLGSSRAWSWQQGPMAQWVDGGPWAVWNDREGDRFVARLYNVDSGDQRTLGAPVYAVSPDGTTALSLDMARLNHLRPGYGYPAPDRPLGGRAPGDSGIWSVPLDGTSPRLILSLRTASRWLRRNLPLRERLSHLRRRYHYWFNHAKFSPDGRRLTVKLRWRRPGGPWSDLQGVSLTLGADGSDLRLLADATSHVIWQTNTRLYLWRRDQMLLFEDAASGGNLIGPIAENVIHVNVHLRQVPPAPSDRPRAYVFDTPYRETVELNLLDPGADRVSHLASFENHVPARGPFRCDLHPCPSADGRRIFVTSLQDGARQVYVVENPDF